MTRRKRIIRWKEESIKTGRLKVRMKMKIPTNRSEKYKGQWLRQSNYNASDSISISL